MIRTSGSEYDSSSHSTATATGASTPCSTTATTTTTATASINQSPASPLAAVPPAVSDQLLREKLAAIMRSSGEESERESGSRGNKDGSGRHSITFIDRGDVAAPRPLVFFRESLLASPSLSPPLFLTLPLALSSPSQSQSTIQTQFTSQNRTGGAGCPRW